MIISHHLKPVCSISLRLSPKSSIRSWLWTIDAQRIDKAPNKLSQRDPN